MSGRTHLPHWLSENRRSASARHLSSFAAAALTPDPRNEAIFEGEAEPALAQLLDGRAHGLQWRQEMQAKADEVSALLQRRPGLRVIMVGDRSDSRVYVSRKEEACRQVRDVCPHVLGF